MHRLLAWYYGSDEPNGSASALSARRGPGRLNTAGGPRVLPEPRSIKGGRRWVGRAPAKSAASSGPRSGLSPGSGHAVRPDSARSTSWAGSRRTRSAAAPDLRSRTRSDDSGERPQPALGDEPLVDAPEAGRERRVDGRPEDGGLAVHRPARAHDQVGAGHQARPVDRMLGHGDRRKRQAAEALRLLGRPRQHDGPDVVAAADVLEHLVEERVLEPVVEGDVGRRAQDDADRLAVHAQRRRHGGIEDDVRQRVLLLEARVADELRRRGRRTGAGGPAGSRRARAPVRPGGSSASAGGSRTRSRTSSCSGRAGRRTPSAGRSSRARARRRSARGGRTGSWRRRGLRRRAPSRPATCLRDGRSRCGRCRAARAARRSARTPVP